MAPQISEHCPKNNPGRLIKKLDWFNRPGVPSTLTPKAGTVHEWITSAAEIKIRILIFIGNTVRLSTSNKRKLLFLNSLVGIIYESNSIELKSEYSYLQYHWCPIVFKVIDGLLISSNKYNNRREGKAINIKIIAGITVQIISMVCPFNKNRFVNLLNNNKIIKYKTNTVIKIRISKEWSWKKINCSINGDTLSCKFRLDHVAINLLNFILWN